MVKRLPVLPSATPDAVFSAATDEFHSLLSAPRTPAAAVAVGRTADDWFDQAMTMAPPPAAPYACRDGCAFCCHLKVVLSPPEAVALIEHLRASLSKEELAALRTRVVETDRKTHGLSAVARARERIPCPLLVDNRCRAYEARPIACRVASSFDAAACERVFVSGVDDAVPHHEAARSYGDAVRGAASSTAHRATLDPRMLELVAALRVGLEQSDTAYAWVRGKRVFAGAVDAEFAAGLTRARGR